MRWVAACRKRGDGDGDGDGGEMVVSRRNGWGEMSVRWVLRPGLRRECVRETSGGKRMEGDGATTGRGRGGERQEGEKKRGDRGRERPGRETERENSGA